MSTADLSGLGLLATQEAVNQVPGRRQDLPPFLLLPWLYYYWFIVCSDVLFSVPVCAQIICSLMSVFSMKISHLSIPGVLGTVAGRFTLDRRRPL